MTSLTAPIVGMHFRPPAKDVINLLPGGCRLILLREPDNPYDAAAVKVLVPGFSPEGEHREIYEGCRLQCAADEFQALPWNSDSLTDPLHLGYVDSKKTGKAAEFSSHMDGLQLTSHDAKLTFGLDGKPAVEVIFSTPTEEQKIAESENKANAAFERARERREKEEAAAARRRDGLDDDIPF